MLRAESQMGGGSHFHDGRDDQSFEPVSPAPSPDASGGVEYRLDEAGFMRVTFHDGDEVQLSH